MKKILYVLPLLSLLSTLSFAEGEATNLKAWNIKENSVKIAFKDNLENEDYHAICVYDNKEYEEGYQEISVKASQGTGKYLIKKVSGLKAGTDYTAKVRTYSTPEGMDGNDYVSKIIHFKTKGTSNNELVATNLRTWNVKNSSAMISFKKNSSIENSAIYFINIDTDERMTLNSKGVIDVPKHRAYSVGKMIDLIPNTTYHIKIVTDELQESDVITFKTKP